MLTITREALETIDLLQATGAAAEAYGRAGFRVVPLHGIKGSGACTCNKGKDCGKSTGKHPRLQDWPNAATTDYTTIAKWYYAGVTSNVGLAMGGPERLIAIDVDGAAGRASLAELELVHGALPETLTSRSGRVDGGEHRIFRVPEEMDIGSIRNLVKFAAGLDVRATGGQIVVAPSVHASGALYTWTTIAPIAPLPTWLFEVIATKPTEAAPPPAPRPAPSPRSATGPSAYDRASKYLATMPGAISGSGGHAATMAAAVALVCGFELSTDDALALLTREFNPRCQPQWTERELRHKVESADKADRVGRGYIANDPARERRPAYQAAPVTEAVNGPPDDWQDPEDVVGEQSVADPPAEQSAKKTTPKKSGPPHLTDMGNAERFAAQHASTHLYSAQLGWLSWDAARYQRDDLGAVMAGAKSTARSILSEARRAEDPDARKAIAAHALRSEAASRLLAMIQLAQSEPGIAIAADVLDRDPWLLNTKSGTIDLRTGELRPHDKADRITKLAPVSYDPKATAPIWEAFLAKVQPDPEVRGFLQRLAGYALTGVVRDHVLPIHYGNGRNGKGTFVNARQRVMGDYAKQIPTELLMATKYEAHPTERATLWGCRFAAAVESKEGRALDVSLVKQLVGGDRISARFMHKDFFDWEPTHKLELATNHRPRIHETKDAIWDRVKLVPWTVKIPEADMDRALGEKLAKEDAGILRWCVEGCLDWQRIGLSPPASVRAATADYRGAEDTFTGFLAARCLLDPDYQIGASELFAAYSGWCEQTEQRPLTQTKFGGRLGEVDGLSKCRETADRARLGRAAWRGIELACEGCEQCEGTSVKMPHTRVLKGRTLELASHPSQPFTRDDGGGLQ